MKRALLLAILLSGCAVQERKEENCIDWGTITYVRERCIPFYGDLVCAEEEVTTLYCRLYDDE
jgi:hypothetical protein